MLKSRPRMLRKALDLVRSSAARREVLHDWRRRLAGEPALPPRPISRVLIVCHGNICRSPFAAVYLAARVPELIISSCGLAAGEAAPADPTAVRVAARLGHDLSHHRSRPLARTDLEQPDLVLVMEASQAAAFRVLAPALAQRVYVLGDFFAAPPFISIADPWNCPEAAYESSFAQISSALDRLAQRVKEHRA
jgi:protein-tyrosine phosphatase